MTGDGGGAQISPDDPIEIGRVGKPHGVRGGFYLDGAIDAAALVPGFEVDLDGRRYEVASRGGMNARPIVSLVGVDSREAAQELRGTALAAPRGTLTPLGEGEWYARDLEGLRVVTVDGEPVGTVTRLTNAP